MAQNPYSNPSGRTEIPWQYSQTWFKNVAITSVRALEEALAKPSNPLEEMYGPAWGEHQDSYYKTCPSCNYSWVYSHLKTCSQCGASFISKSTNSAPVLLHPEDEHLLDDPAGALKDLEPQELADLHNLLVVALRSACNEMVNDGGDALEVRDGLVVTREWDAHFTNLYAAQPKTLIWIALRHAMLGNPLEGEITEWSNKGQKSKSSQNSVGMLAGAGALGLLAGFLWG